MVVVVVALLWLPHDGGHVSLLMVGICPHEQGRMYLIRLLWLCRRWWRRGVAAALKDFQSNQQGRRRHPVYVDGL